MCDPRMAPELLSQQLPFNTVLSVLMHRGSGRNVPSLGGFSFLVTWGLLKL